MKKTLILAVLALGFSHQLAAQVVINFSGANGSPLTVIIPEAITFTATASDSGMKTWFRAVPITGNPGGAGNSSVVSSLTYQVNGGAPIALDSVELASFGYAMEFRTNVASSFVTGDTITLNAGSFTTDNSVAVNFEGGTFQMFVQDSNLGTQISSFGISSDSAVPEPSTYAAIAGALALGVTAMKRRRPAVVSITP